MGKAHRRSWRDNRLDRCLTQARPGLAAPVPALAATAALVFACEPGARALTLAPARVDL